MILPSSAAAHPGHRRRYGDIAAVDAAAAHRRAHSSCRRTRRRSVSWSSRSLADAPKGGEGRITEDCRAVCDQGRRPILADGAAALAAPPGSTT